MARTKERTIDTTCVWCNAYFKAASKTAKYWPLPRQCKEMAYNSRHPDKAAKKQEWKERALDPQARSDNRLLRRELLQMAVQLAVPGEDPETTMKRADSFAKFVYQGHVNG